MSIPSDFNTWAPSQKFAHFVGEVTGVAGKIIGALESYTLGQIEETITGNESLKTLVQKVKNNSDLISQAFFIIGCFYNFYTSPLLFLTGVGLGTLASAASFPNEIKSLQQGELLGRTAKDGYAASKVMFGLATLNFYLGRTLLDDMAISIFSGLIAGNSFYHRFKESAFGVGIYTTSNKLANLTELALQKLPFTVA